MVVYYFGKVVEVKEQDGLNKVTAAAGSGPGYVFELMRIYALAIKNELGFSEKEAELITLSTFYGCAKMAMESNKSLAELRDMVATKGGTTEAGLRKLLKNINRDVNEGKNPEEILSSLKTHCDSSFLYDILCNTVSAAYQRSIELGEKKNSNSPRIEEIRDIEDLTPKTSLIERRRSFPLVPNYRIK